MKSVAVFCGSSSGVRPVYAASARELGSALAARGMRLVYGGGRVGLMGAVAEACLAAGGEVTGVIPQALLAREVGFDALPDLRVVRSMHERKALMADLADAFVALPGGCGTFEEFFEVVTWAQLGLHAKPCGLLDVASYYAPLTALLDGAVREGFLKAEHRAIVFHAEGVEALLDGLAHHRPPVVAKWIDETET